MPRWAVKRGWRKREGDERGIRRAERDREEKETYRGRKGEDQRRRREERGEGAGKEKGPARGGGVISGSCGAVRRESAGNHKKPGMHFRAPTHGATEEVSDYGRSIEDLESLGRRSAGANRHGADRHAPRICSGVGLPTSRHSPVPCFICLYLCDSLYRAIPPVICP